MPLGVRLGGCRLNTLVVSWRPLWGIKSVWDYFDANWEWFVLVRQNAGEGLNRLRDYLTHLSASMAIRLQRAPEIAAMFKGFAIPLRAWGARRLGVLLCRFVFGHQKAVGRMVFGSITKDRTQAECGLQDAGKYKVMERKTPCRVRR